MTNKEKALICSNCLTGITKSCHNGCVLFESYKVMEWKDQQFGKIIAQIRKWLDEQGKLDKLNLVEFDMEIKKLLEEKK